MEWLIVSGAVNLCGHQCGKPVTVMVTVYHTDHQNNVCVQHGGREARRRAGLSAAAETCMSYF